MGHDHVGLDRHPAFHPGRQAQLVETFFDNLLYGGGIINRRPAQDDDRLSHDTTSVLALKYNMLCFKIATRGKIPEMADRSYISLGEVRRGIPWYTTPNPEIGFMSRNSASNLIGNFGKIGAPNGEKW
jgi:hypothetical protein